MTEKYDLFEQVTFRGRRHGRKLRPRVHKLVEENLPHFLVKEAIDRKKDQSYFLFATLKDQLDYVRFHLGNYLKSEI